MLNDDILVTIFGYIRDGITYKSIIFSSNYLKQIIERYHPTLRNKVTNHLQTLVMRYPFMNWEWHELSYNPSITMEFIKDHIDDYNWNWMYVSENPNLTIQFILDHIQYVNNKNIILDWYSISRNKGISFEDIKLHINNPNLKWNHDELSRNLSITLIDIENDTNNHGISQLGINWDWRIISGREDLTEVFVRSHINIDWDWEALSYNESLSLEFIELYFDKFTFPTLQEGLSHNPNLTLKFILTHLYNINDAHIEWDWSVIWCNKNITLTDIELYIDNPNIDRRYISRNPNITMEFIESHLNDFRYMWNWQVISNHPNLTMDFIKSHLTDIKWDWLGISGNQSIKFAEIMANINNPNMYWNWSSISYRKDITPEIIKLYPNKWDLRNLMTNPHLTIDFIESNITNPDLYWQLLSFNAFNHYGK